MTPSEKLKEIELTVAYSNRLDTEDIKWLISTVMKLTEALETINRTGTWLPIARKADVYNSEHVKALVNALELIYADGSYDDIASQFAKEALDKWKLKDV